jgi:two-component sensor histidine kinase
MRPPTEPEPLDEIEALRGQIRELQSRQQRLCAFLECQQTFGEPLDLGQVERQIVRQASIISGTAGVRLFLLEEASPVFRCCDGDTLSSDEIRTLEFMVGAEIPEPPAEGKSCSSADAAKDSPPARSILMLHLGQVSYLGLPLMPDERMRGILAIPTLPSRRYTAEEIGLFSAFTRHAAVALKNARQCAAARQELTECRRGEASLQSALAERDALLREVHHRVKNNLQVVASLLDLQVGTLLDASTRQAVREIKDRVQSMARIHEHLFQSPDAGRISMDDYLRQLATALRQASNAERIGLSLQVDAAPFNADRAIPCGLIVNELVSNAFKHAFPDGQAGEVAVALENRDGQYVLTVQDTGVGLPPHLDPQFTGSLGLRLVGLLAKQLGGVLHLASEQGTAARITFPARPLDRNAS